MLWVMLVIVVIGVWGLIQWWTNLTRRMTDVLSKLDGESWS